MISNVRNSLKNLCSLLLLVLALFCSVLNSHAATEIVTITSVDIRSRSVVLNTDSKKLEFKSTTLGAPSRLVVDIENALPDFTDRTFTINDEFKTLRIGLYGDKTRFVFDAINDVLPKTKIVESSGKLIVTWGNESTPITPAVEPVAVGLPRSVQSINFDTVDGSSEFSVNLSSAADLISPIVEGDMIRFGVKNTVIPRSLRRVVDASVFPSAVLQITPYSTIIAGERSVMFAARMKGPVDYAVSVNGATLVFTCVDGPFAEVAAEKMSSVSLPVEPAAIASSVTNMDDVSEVIESLSDSPQESTQDITSCFNDKPMKVYTGEPVTLVFDDADIRKVMQLIAEISDQNLILSDGVKGKISLRLNDVPWDQALDLVLEIKELGTISQGNVVRVLPLKQIEAMETERLKARQTIKSLEETVTQIFEVNYKDVDSVEDVIEDMLTDQGEVSAIDGSKKLMVTDIPSKLVEIGELLTVLDEPVKQVLIEARIVEMRATEGLDLGVNWGINHTNDAGLKEINRSISTSAVSSRINPEYNPYYDPSSAEFNPAIASDSPYYLPNSGSSYVTTTAKYLTRTFTDSLVRKDGKETVTSGWKDSDDVTSSSSDTSLVGIGANAINDLAFGLGGAFLLPSTLGTSGLGGIINFGRLGSDSTVLNMRLSALESSGNVKVVSSPRVLTMDGESARIEQGTQIPYQSISEKGTVTEFKNATLALEVTPEVNPDDTVILEIIASNSTIGSTVSTGVGSAPAIDTKEAETKLLLQDGETTVIGGIFVENTIESNTGTPFLKDIPYLGKLFESNSSSSDRSELLIFITPHIVVQ